MGKYIFNYSAFVNESASMSTTTASQILALADQYTETDSYKAEDYSTPEKLSTLTDTLYSQIKTDSGETDATAFMTAAMELAQKFVSEDACPTCEEMMEPCDACKAHAEEMKSEEDGN